MNALVLGGNGFIGSHLVDRLLLAGHKVRVFDSGPELFRAPLKQVDYRMADFSDLVTLTESLEDIDVVFHLIGTTTPSTSNADPIGDIQSNLVNTVQLLQAMNKKNVSKMVFLSSGGTVYGKTKSELIREDHDLNPICSYGVVKVAIEKYIRMFHSLYGLEFVILRAANPYGERHRNIGVQGIVGTFLQKILTGEKIEIWGDGSIVRDFVYVGDLADLCLQAGMAVNNQTFNAGSGIGVSVNQIVKTLSAVTRKEINPIYLAGRSYDSPKVVLDISSARDTYQWSPSVSLEEGILRTWEWMKSK